MCSKRIENKYDLYKQLQSFYKKKYRLYNLLEIICIILSFIFFSNLVFYVFGFEFFKFTKNSSVFGDYWNNLLYGLSFGIISYKAVNICKNKKEKYNKLLHELK